MASDRWITFERERPTPRILFGVVSEFIGPDRDGIWMDGCGTDRSTTYLITIAGRPGWNEEHFDECPYRPERFIDVVTTQKLRVKVVDVITRQADPLTCAIADGLHAYIARRLDGTKGLLESP